MGALLIFLVGILFFCLLVRLHRFLDKEWWTPLRIQSMMRRQGVTGPSYRFLHGNTKEIVEMRKEALKIHGISHHHALQRIHPHIYAWRKIYGKNFLQWCGSRPQFVVTDPDVVKEILNNKDETFGKISSQEYTKKLLGDGLILSGGQKWTKMRKLANYAFHGESLKGMVPEMIASVEMMLERWRKREGKEIEVFQEFKVLTSEVISRTAFGSSYLEGERVFALLMQMAFLVGRNHYKVKVSGISIFHRTEDDIESDRILDEIRRILKGLVKKREEEASRSLGEADNHKSDFLGLLVKALNDPDSTKKISIDDLIDECKNFYVAGQETTANSLTWVVFLLALHKDWQEEARKEILELFGQGKPTLDGAARMKIMSMIINESLRLYPPAFALLRRVTRDVKLEGKILLPQNTEVHISNMAIHYDPEIWGDDVHLFKPERFKGGVAAATNNNISAFLPFGAGPRICVGLSFALAELKIALAMILQQYRFTLSSTYVHSPVHIFTITPQYGVQIVLETL